MPDAGVHCERLPPSRVMVADRRAVRRTSVLRCAKIIVPRRSPVIHCTVQNITSTGACLKVASTAGVPAIFELTFEHGRTRRQCRVVWRTADMLGVKFETAEQAAAQAGNAGIIVIAE